MLSKCSRTSSICIGYTFIVAKPGLFFGGSTQFRHIVLVSWVNRIFTKICWLQRSYWNNFFSAKIQFTPWSRGKASAKQANSLGFDSPCSQFFFSIFSFFFQFLSIFFSLVVLPRFFKERYLIKKEKKKKMKKKFCLRRDSNPRQVWGNKMAGRFSYILIG